MPTLMRAAVFVEPLHARVDEVPMPQPGPEQIRVRVEGCGVCGSNLPTWEGRPWFHYPMPAGAPGHEGWGSVEAIGREVTGIQPGDRVAFLSSNAFAEYDLAGPNAFVRLPEALKSQPYPGEPVGCAMNVVRRSDLRAGQAVAVIGIGFLGALITRLASAAGARVIAIGRRRFALDLAKALGAEHALPMGEPGAVEAAVRELTGGEGCDRVVEAVGAQGPLDLAGRLTRVRGKLVIAGYHQDGLRQVDLQLWNWRGIDVINAHERDPRAYLEGMRLGIEAILEGTLDLGPLLTHRVPLGECDAAFQLMRHRPEGFLKAVVAP